jgi:hypothetical protein
MICSMCKIGEHDGCAANGIGLCLCPVCWVDDDKNEDLDEIPADEGD